MTKNIIGKEEMNKVRYFLREFLVRGERNDEDVEMRMTLLFENAVKCGDTINKLTAWLLARALENPRYKKMYWYGQSGMEDVLKKIYRQFPSLRNHVKNWWYHDNGMKSTDLIIADKQEKARARTTKKAYRWIHWREKKEATL